MFRAFAILCALAFALVTQAFAADTPGVTATEIRIGGIFPFSGPASSIGLVGRGILAYVQSINDRGGINGRKLTTSPMTMPIVLRNRSSMPASWSRATRWRSCSASSGRPATRRRQNT